MYLSSLIFEHGNVRKTCVAVGQLSQEGWEMRVTESHLSSKFVKYVTPYAFAPFSFVECRSFRGLK